MRHTTSLVVAFCVTVAAGAFTERLDFFPQPGGQQLVIFSWGGPAGHFADFGASVQLTSGRGITYQPSNVSDVQLADILLSPQGTAVKFEQLHSTNTSDLCSWCAWFETTLSKAEQRIDSRLWQAAGLRSCFVHCPSWPEGKDVQRQAISTRFSNSVYVSSFLRGAEIFHPAVLGVDAVRRLAAGFSACGLQAGIAAVLDQGALASARWWRMRLHVRDGGAGRAQLQIALLLPGDRPSGPASMAASPGLPAAPGMHKLGLMSAAQQQEHHSDSSVRVFQGRCGAPLQPCTSGLCFSGGRLLNRGKAVGAPACDSSNLSSCARVLFPACAFSDSTQVAVGAQLWTATDPASPVSSTPVDSSAPADLLLPLLEGATAEDHHAMYIRSSLEHVQRGMGVQVLVHDVSIPPLPSGTGVRLHLQQRLPQWIKWVSQRSTCSTLSFDTPDAPRFTDCVWNSSGDPFTELSTASVHLPLLPTERPQTVRFRMFFDGHYMPAGSMYPSDAHRGFDIPPATAQLLEIHSAQAHVAGSGSVTTEASAQASPLWVASGHALPMEGLGPDFSMPYNVVTVSLTILASVGGGLINLLLRWGRLHATVPKLQ